MEYSILADIYDQLEKESGKIKKTGILSQLLEKTSTEILPKIVLLASGKIFPSYSDKKTGIANKMMIRAIAKATGFSEGDVTDRFKKTGDLGLAAESLITSKTQLTLMRKPLTVEFVYQNLEQLAGIEGEGSQEKKLDFITELLVSSKPKEARYIVRTILETLRIGIAEGIVRDAISKAFNVNPSHVEKAWFFSPDYGEIAKIAKEGGEKGLAKVKMQPGKPIVVMLGEKSPSLEKAMEEYENFVLEYKYDGVRIQVHKSKEKIWLFTRRLENVTEQFPDLVELVKKAIKPEECIIEGEAIGINPKTGEPVPFQDISRRVQRKYDIDLMVKKIPMRLYIFDIMYLNGKNMLNNPYKKRRELLKESIEIVKGKLELAHSLMTKNVKEAKSFYNRALKEKQEGLFVKNLNAKYQPGRRVGSWLKVKPILEPLDLIIVGAEWGTGKRSNWLSSFEIACREPSTGEPLRCGKLGTGLTDEQFRKMTKKLRNLIISEKGREVKLKPEIVIEVGYEEIQKSPKYESGFALRFPRLLRFRDDKSREDVNSLNDVKKLFEQQFSTK